MSPPGTALRPGLCSVTLRHLPAEEVIALAAAAGLETIEWGADVHAPAHSPAGLATIADASRHYGVGIASYGSYWRAGTSSLAEGEAALRAADALGCHRVRVWAGVAGSDVTDAPVREAVVRDVRTLADRAATLGLEIAFEHHDRTLADTPASTLDLLAAVDRPNVGTYWQPRVGETTDVAVAGLEALLPYVRAVHVFSWWPGIARLPLADRADLWTRVMAVLASTGRGLDLLLEFVPDDDASVLPTEAATLRGWIDGATEGRGPAR
ncbi:sugar phosphate isomerase/epimerase family protein [Mumia sp. DW29H23]|uniref:sugar phosphate isomerase/epimerase family protein n=1 Tax=Mumia sp. DW29H23 TaxID=3421241 RepID=UPI003D6984E1